MEWETVIGLEVHVQLNTATKIFSGASTAFGAEPNTQACAIDLAMPGTLPVVNAEAYRKAIMFGLAIDASITKRSAFERKNYFYPDLPKGYQTTQLDAPIVGPGHIDLQLDEGKTKRVRIHHAHLEEDAGKSLHDLPGLESHGMSGIDLNRAGTPLIEVVSEPDMNNSDEAVAFAKQLHSIVTSIGICDGKMAQGSMRFDVNISVRPKGQKKLGTRTETKNLNSFKFMEECIALEVERQIDILEDGGSIAQETRLYNSDTKTSKAMRSKEEANDYRYFPCPDLLPVEIDDNYIEAIRKQLPELPVERQVRFVETYKLSDYDASLLSACADLASYFEAAAGSDAKLAANWVMGEVSARLNSEDKDIGESPVSGEMLGGMIARLKDNTISSKQAKQVFEGMWLGEGDADTVIEKRGLKQVSDTGALEAMVDDVLAANTAMIEDYKNTDDSKRKKKLGGFMGQIMKASKGQANPQMINQILLKKLNKLL